MTLKAIDYCKVKLLMPLSSMDDTPSQATLDAVKWMLAPIWKQSIGVDPTDYIKHIQLHTHKKACGCRQGKPSAGSSQQLGCGVPAG